MTEARAQTAIDQSRESRWPSNGTEIKQALADLNRLLSNLPTVLLASSPRECLQKLDEIEYAARRLERLGHGQMRSMGGDAQSHGLPSGAAEAWLPREHSAQQPSVTQGDLPLLAASLRQRVAANRHLIAGLLRVTAATAYRLQRLREVSSCLPPSVDAEQAKATSVNVNA